MFPSLRVSSLLLLCAGVAWNAPVLQAQETKAPTKATTPAAGAAAGTPPSITVVQASAQGLIDDLKYVLTTGGEGKTFDDKLKDLLDVYIVGVERGQPVVTHLKASGTDFKSVLHVPVANLKDFLANIKSLDVRTKKLPVPELYQISGLFAGFLKTSKTHAVFAESRADVSTTLVPDAKLMAPLSGKKYDLAAYIVNTPAQEKERRDALVEIRKQVLSGLKAKKGEPAEEFAIRKLTVEQQFAEIERFYAEAAEIFLIWNTDAAAKTATMDLDLTGLPGTPLHASIQLVGSTPSAFPGILVDNKAALSGIANFALDEMRQGHLSEMLKLTRPQAKSRIEASKTLSAEEKAQAVEAAEMLHKVTEDVIASKVFNGFVLATENSNKTHTIVGGLKVKGQIVVEGLDAIAKAGAKIEKAVEKEGDLEIHKMPLPASFTDLQDLLGKDQTTVFVATGAEVVYYAVGEGALEKLKETIKKSVEPAAADAPNPGLAFHARLEPWLKVVDLQRIKNKTGDAAVRKAALAGAAGGNDTMDFSLSRDGEQIKLKFTAQEGLIRVAGKVIAKFVNDAL